MKGSYFNYKRILVPLDGSELAEQAINPALTLVGKMNARVIFLNVVTPMPMKIDPFQRVVASEREKSEQYLKSLQTRFLHSLEEADTRIVIGSSAGSPAEVIINRAYKNGIDLIINTSHGYTNNQKWVSGGVADKVCRGAHCDTLIIRTSGRIKPFTRKRILVPLDGSPLAEQALRPALGIAKATDSELTLLRVSPPMSEEQGSLGSNGPYKHIDSKVKQEAKTYLQTIHSSIENTELAIKIEPLTGPVATTIVDYAQNYHVDLIVMSSHGRSGVGPWNLGSVVTKVFSKAHCSILIVRPRIAKTRGPDSLVTGYPGEISTPTMN